MQHAVRAERRTFRRPAVRLRGFSSFSFLLLFWGLSGARGCGRRDRACDRAVEDLGVHARGDHDGAGVAVLAERAALQRGPWRAWYRWCGRRAGQWRRSDRGLGPGTRASTSFWTVSRGQPRALSRVDMGGYSIHPESMAIHLPSTWGSVLSLEINWG